MAAMTAVVAEAATSTQAELSVECKDNNIETLKKGEAIEATVFSENAGAKSVNFRVEVTGLTINKCTYKPGFIGKQSNNDFLVEIDGDNQTITSNQEICVIEFLVTDPENMSIKIVPDDGTKAGMKTTWEYTAQTTESSSSDTESSSTESSTDSTSTESSTETSSTTSSTDSSSTPSTEQSSSTDSKKSDIENVDTGVAGFAVFSVVLLAGASVVLARKK